MTKLEVPVRGGLLHAVRYGAAPSTSSPILAVHGITSSSRTWSAVARERGDIPLVAVDLRGRGASNGLPPPYGIAAHVEDLLATLDHLGLERTVLVGHSLGAYLVAGLAAEHPERAAAVVLVDGGLRIPGTERVDPQAFLDGFLGLAVARLRMHFESRDAYREWWRAHPAIAAGDVAEEDLVAYADHDLVGTEPELHSAVVEEAVRVDAAELFELGDPASRLTVPATLLCAARGLRDEPSPMQPIALAREWEAASPELRQAIEVPDTNHYTLVLGASGARAVSEAVMAAVP